jgi:probable rRNA maturation factor
LFGGEGVALALTIHGARVLREHRADVLRTVRRSIKAGLLGEGRQVSIHFVLDVEMRVLNRRYRGKDSTTDVLSFPAWQEGDDAFHGGEDILGDIVIAAETMFRQARRCGHDPSIEGAVLAVHGALHLLGVDHERSVEEHALQLQLEASWLSAAGISPCAALSGRGVT